MDHPSLNGKVAIVTGAAMGMGAATARLFAQAGAKVLAADRNEEMGRAVVADINDAGGTAVFQSVDVSKASDVEAMVQASLSHFGTLDVAVNNAALIPDTHPIHELDEVEFDAIIAVNLKGVALCMKYEIAHLVEQGIQGSIVNISSVSGIRPQFNASAYTAAKHAVIGMTKVAALENGKRGIRVNAIAPGAIDTPMLQTAAAQSGSSAEAAASVLSLFNRLGKPEEVAQAWPVAGFGSQFLCHRRNTGCGCGLFQSIMT